jgi:hypothetical protein
MRAVGGLAAALLTGSLLGCDPVESSPAPEEANVVASTAQVQWRLLNVLDAPAATFSGFHVLVAVAGTMVSVSQGTAAEVDWYALDPKVTFPAAPPRHPLFVSGALNAIALAGETMAVGVPWPPGNDKVLVYDRVTSGENPVVLTDPRLPVGTSEALGFSVALSGDTLAAGAPETSYDDDIGHVLVFHRSNGVWSETPVADIQAPPDPEQPCYTTAADERFGLTVGLATLRLPDAPHEVLLAGRPLLLQPGTCAQNETARFAGNVFVYDHLPSASWPATPTSTLVSADAAASSCHFGSSLGLGGDSIVVAQEAPRQQQVFVAGHATSTQRLETGSIMSFDGATLAATDGSSISIYRREAAQSAAPPFSAASPLPNPPGFSAQWSSLAVSGDVLVAGATDGRAYVFLRRGVSTSSPIDPSF